ncbi:hypothetical protein [Phocaeicola plebeius]|uniref:hypothetical protein n=1 Tax=Phocaeicola plebeius TaxID=310297 RepID=UPI0026ED7139|nr:hypothetical protein [Phocaeicola plebeius]
MFVILRFPLANIIFLSKKNKELNTHFFVESLRNLIAAMEAHARKNASAYASKGFGVRELTLRRAKKGLDRSQETATSQPGQELIFQLTTIFSTPQTFRMSSENA